jgi:arylsulfatase A-like enzyme
VVNGTASNETGYATSVNVDDALSWLGTLDEDAPWLLWMAFNAPHTPFHKPPNNLHDYDHLEDNDDVPGSQAGEYYLAMLQALDTEIGRLLDHLRATGDYDDTVVIFLGDNGSSRFVAGEPFDRDHAKDTLTEGGAAVPFVVAGPGIEGGRADAALVSVVDVFATVLETAGVDVAATTAADPVDSESLWPVLLQSGKGRDQMLTQLFGGQNSEGRDEGHAIRDATYKLICRLDGTVDLFDLATDRWEATDLYVTGPSPGLETVYADLAAALEAWIGQDVCP